MPLALVALLVHVGCQECCNDRDCALAAAADGRDDDDVCLPDGSCGPGDIKVEALVTCTDVCENGEVCVNGDCAPAPGCLRLDRKFVGLLNGTTRGEVEATTVVGDVQEPGCGINFAYDFGDGRSTAFVGKIARSGAFEDPVGMNPGGTWSSVLHAGRFEVSNVGGSDAVIEFSTDSYGCIVDADCDGQVLRTCGAGDDGVGRCE